MPAYERVLVGDADKLFLDRRYAYDASDNLVYFGGNSTPSASTTATDWEIWKFTYTSNNVTRKQGPLTGAWDSRTSLSW